MCEAGSDIYSPELKKLLQLVLPKFHRLMSLLGLVCASLGGMTNEDWCCDLEGSPKYICQARTVLVDTSKSKFYVDTCLLAASLGTVCTLGVIEQGEVVGIGPASQAFTICVVGIIVLFYVLAFVVTSIKTSVLKC